MSVTVDVGDDTRRATLADKEREEPGEQRGRTGLRSGPNRKSQEEQKSLLRPEGGAAEPGRAAGAARSSAGEAGSQETVIRNQEGLTLTVFSHNKSHL